MPDRPFHRVVLSLSDLGRRHWIWIPILVVASWLLHLLYVPRPPALDPEKPIQIHWQPGRWPLLEPLVAAMDRATQSIDACAFSLDHPEFHLALHRAAERGVHIRLRTHKTPQWGLPESAEVKCGPFGKGLFHAKALVIDQKELWIGSANFSADGLTSQANLLVGLLAPQLAQFCSQRLWYDSVPGQQTKVQLLWHGAPVSVELAIMPLAGVEENVLGILRRAKRSCRSAQYVLTAPHWVEALSGAHQRGVDVSLVLEKPNLRIPPVRQAQNTLRKQRVPTSTWIRPSLCHHKMLWIDEEQLILGSANATKAAWTINREVVLLFTGLPLELQEELEKGWNRLRGLSRPMVDPASKKQLHLFATCAHVANDSGQTQFVNCAHRCSRQTQAHKALLFFEPKALQKQVGQKTTLRLAGHFQTDPFILFCDTADRIGAALLRTAPCHFTYSGHGGSSSPLKIVARE
jgi:cardiolipin synthase